jgi:hypothetical protein
MRMGSRRYIIQYGLESETFQKTIVFHLWIGTAVDGLLYHGPKVCGRERRLQAGRDTWVIRGNGAG